MTQFAAGGFSLANLVSHFCGAIDSDLNSDFSGGFWELKGKTKLTNSC